MGRPGEQAPIEQLLSILYENTDPQIALQRSLKFLIDAAGCQGGAIFILGKKPIDVPLWFSDSIPQDWKDGFYNHKSALQRAMVQMTSSNAVQPADPSLGLAGGLPISQDNQTYGGIFFYGPGCTGLPISKLIPLVRLLTLTVSRNNEWSGDTTAASRSFCDLLTSTQNTFLGLQEIQQRVIQGVRRLVDPDSLNIYYLYPEKNNLVDKLEWNLRNDRTSQGFLTLGQSVLKKALADKKAQLVENPQNCSYFTAEIDSQADQEICADLVMPMIVNNEAIGAVGMLFKNPPLISIQQRSMLNTLVTALGFAAINSRHIQQLRIVNADVEANRWEIMRSRNILRALFDSLPSSIYIIDQSSRIVAANVSRAKRVNAHPMQLVGKKCYEALYNRTDLCPGCLVNETLFVGNNTSRQSRVWVEDQPVDWEISTFVVLNDQNQPGQAILIEQDVTEKQRLEANLIQSEKLAAVGQLAAGVVHEINNPLAAIIANAQILSRDLADNEDMLESVHLIELAGLRASQVVKNLLGFARKEQYDFEPINLNETLERAVQLIQHKLISQSVTLAQDLAEDMPLILGSRDHLEGVWVNLMMNAMDAMRDQEHPGKLSISSRYLINEYRVTIADNGHGIPPDKISHIFEPFYTTKGFNQGTGLGLSIVHRVIKNHSGYITVDSLVGEGTKFTVVLPGNTRASQSKPK